ncbi:MAG: DNA polymerase III subunit alpha [Alphaproteobacteria bacterium 41-28]|nr:MAG: DNA polymerase III subunit alpha [Alphaproteobacteria bacterium 41-28]
MFIHLRVHTAYSLLEGAIPVKKLIDLAKKHQMPAVAMTDTGNLFGAMEFSLAAKEAGIQPIMGCQIQINSPGSDRKNETHALILLAQNQQGYQNLLKIISHTYINDKERDAPQIDFETLTPWTKGLLALTGGFQGGLAKRLARGLDGAAYLNTLETLFKDRLYIEISRQGVLSSEQQRIEDLLLDLAYARNLPLVATNEAFFPEPEFYEAHDALLCIAEGTYVNEENRRRLTPDHCFKSSQEMEALFADLPEAIANTRIIAQRCSYLLTPINPILPSFPCQDEVEELRTQARLGLEERLTRYVFTPEMNEKTKTEKRDIYSKQLEYELTVIEEMKFPGYFLIVADFIKWAKAQHIPVGPGRGSGAGSVVAWSLTITDLDPLRWGLFFERFLNPERVSMPDFDIDFCQERRDEVIRYVRDKYGADRVAHIITFGKLQARAVLRDVGRVLQMPYGQVDKICKLIPNNPANPVTLEEAIGVEPQLGQMIDQEPEVKHLVNIALQLEGLYRHASTHAAGVVIGDRPLDELVPLYYDARSPLPATQFNMKYVEQAGLVKFDFLGLKTLTVIQQTVEYLKEQGVELDISCIPLDDPKTFELLRRAETIGLFQLESGGMTDALRKLKPEQFEEITALNALYRPGPMDDIPRYIACRHGEEKVAYLYPELEPILSETYGVIVYQEHVLRIARDLAGYTLGGADVLRRAMGKKIKSEMDDQRKRFIDGILDRVGGKPETAKTLFDQIEKFASYAFPKAHAAAYALITYQTAYLKTHHPVEYMAALMTHELNNTDKLTFFAREVKRLGIELLSPDVNHSHAGFKVEKGAIRYALAAIKNVGAAAMDGLREERRKNGPYKDIFDFVERIDGRVMNKRQMENLIFSGVFDSLSPNRRQLMENLELLLRYGNEDKRSQSLFGLEVTRPKLNEVEDWAPLEKLRYEFAAMGFYLTAHPLDAYGSSLEQMGIIPASEIYTHAQEKGEAQTYRLAGIVITKQERAAKSGQRYAFVQLSDPTGVFEVTVFSELLSQYRDQLEPGTALLVTVSVQLSDDVIRLTCQDIECLEKAADGGVVTLTLQSGDQVSSLKSLLEKASPGKTRIVIKVNSQGAISTLVLPSTYALAPNLRASLKDLLNVA